MDIINENEVSFNEKKSLQIIKSAIETSKRTLKDDGLLLILWGFVLSTANYWRYYESVKLTSWWMRDLMKAYMILSGIAVIGITVYFIFFRKKKVRTFTSISVRYVWIGVILADNVLIMITKVILDKIDFVLLQPMQMVLIGFALFVSAGIYRYHLLSLSGIIMWVAAAIAVNYDLNLQFLVRSIAEVICFIIPGTFMYMARKKNN